MEISEKIKKYNQIVAQLKQERESFIAQWKVLNDYILPNRARFLLSENNKGDRKNLNIVDTKATMAVETLSSGMMSGITNPSRSWFNMSLTDEESKEIQSVQYWTEKATKTIRSIYLRSNLYNVLPMVFKDVITFGTACMLMEEDFESVVRFRSIPIGSYSIGMDSKGRVNKFCREYRWTVSQIVEEYALLPNGDYDWDNVSSQVKTLWDNNKKEHWIDITHIIIPNPEYNPKLMQSKYKKFLSCTYEPLGMAENKMLKESGYDFFPVLAARWSTTGDDVYGTSCPGMVAIGKIKALQLKVKRAAQNIELFGRPPLVAPTSAKQTRVSMIPGDITYSDDPSKISKLFDTNFNLSHMDQSIERDKQEISEIFYEDLILMFTRLDRSDITATEANILEGEKLMVFGPVLQQLNQDILDPMIENTFELGYRQGKIPEPPEEIQGKEWKIEYISIMAQAQKLMGSNSLDTYMQFAMQAANLHPESLDKTDFDKMLEVKAEILSIPAGIVRPDEVVQSNRDQRAQALQAQQQLAAMSQGATMAKDLSQANLEGENALSSLINSTK